MGYKKNDGSAPKPDPKVFSKPKTGKGSVKKSQGSQPANPVN